MKSKLPCFALVVAALLGSPAAGQTPPPRPASPAAPGEAAQLLERARVTLARQASVEAKIRQQIYLFDQKLFGSGVYLQQGTGPELQMRMELKLQVGGQVSSLLQIADGRFLWADRQTPQQHTVRRIDLRQLQQQWGPLPDELRGRWPPIGGLGALLAGLAANFQFDTVTTDQVGDVPVYRMLGRLRPERLREQAVARAEDPEQVRPLDAQHLPEQVPAEVLLVLGQDDLFPYLIDYRTDSRAAAGEPRSLVRIQLFEVRLGGPIDLRQFVYKPGSVAVEDATEAVLEQLREREKGVGDRD